MNPSANTVLSYKFITPFFSIRHRVCVYVYTYDCLSPFNVSYMSYVFMTDYLGLGYLIR